MCGRTCCALCPETYQKATTYFNDKENCFEKPIWKDIPNNGKKFMPSNNIAPTDVTPVLISGSHVNDLECMRIMQPMMWGLIPRWHQGDLKHQRLSTNNCRIEGITASKLYGPCIRKGQRCVIICEGFYEWKTIATKNKQPYFIYNPQPKGYKVEDKHVWLNAEWTQHTGWSGPRLLHMAGLFDIWHSESDEEIYSYAIITMDSNESLSWCHHRMPAILSTDEQIEAWLDIEGVGTKDALEVLKPVKVLGWHPVSSDVNRTQNKGPQINKPVQNLGKSNRTFMDKWLKSGCKGIDEKEGPNIKKFKFNIPNIKNEPDETDLKPTSELENVEICTHRKESEYFSPVENIKTEPGESEVNLETTDT